MKGKFQRNTSLVKFLRTLTLSSHPGEPTTTGPAASLQSGCRINFQELIRKNDIFRMILPGSNQTEASEAEAVSL
jgi:hypothetical protein